MKVSTYWFEILLCNYRYTIKQQYTHQAVFHDYKCVGPHPDTDNIMDPKPAEGEEQAKKRRGRKKSKLEDMFPAYLQVCVLSVNLVGSRSVFIF